MKYKDYYKILGVTKDAGKAEIHRAYRKLARKYHPDINKKSNADTKFRDINEAKEVLQNPEKRKLYDMYGSDWEQAGRQSSPEWNRGKSDNGSNRDQSPPNFDNTDEFQGTNDFSDFFNDLFGGRSAGNSSRARHENYFSAVGNSREAEIELSLPEVISGATRTITFGVFEVGSDGRATPKEKNLQVKIPKGLTNGSVIRLAGQGEKGFGGGRNGDLLLKIKILPDIRFHVVGHDLHTSISVSPWEAALGTILPVKTVDGTINLTIPAGTQNGKRFRLRGLGLPKKGVSSGDIIIGIDIRVPHSLTDKEKQLFEELSKISEFDPREAGMQRAKYHEKV